MTLGRIFRLDHKLRQDRSVRWLLTIFQIVLAAFLFSFVTVEVGRPSGAWRELVLAAALFVGFAAVLDYIRWVQSFELRLLPDGVQFTNWGRTITLIEPEIVGGRYLAWFDRITFRSGGDRATIQLNWFQKRLDRAAILAHCSQFLSPQQQADFGQEWAALYCRLITPPKPVTGRKMALTCLISFVVGSLVLVSVTEYLIWLHPDLVLRNGLSLRIQYLGWLLFPSVPAGPLTLVYLIEKLKARRKPTTAA